MVSTDMATRDKQINFRVSEEEAARFDRVASHYGIPLAAMLRMLVKERDEQIAAAKALADSGKDDFRWTDKHRDVLRWVIQQSRRGPVERGEIERALGDGHSPWTSICYGGGTASCGRELNDLRRNEYVRKVSGGYVATGKTDVGRV